MSDIEKVNPRQVSGAAALTLDTVDGAAGVFRAAKLLSESSLVPEAFRSRVVKGRGDNARVEENTEAPGNCAIAIDMANRMGIAALAVCQNLHVIEGKPSWSSPFIIASINRSGKFHGSLGFSLSPEGAPEEVSYTVTEWSGGQRQRVTKKATIRNRECYAYAVEASTGEVLKGPVVSMKMAVAESWFSKEGSKWQTMPEMMLRYRAASFFGRVYAPELLLGIPASDELEDAAPAPAAAPQVIDATEQPAAPTPAAAARAAARTPRQPKAEPAPAPTAEPTPPPAAEPVSAAPAAEEAAEEEPPAPDDPTKPYTDAERNRLLNTAKSVPVNLRKKAAEIAIQQGIRDSVDACVAFHTQDAKLWLHTVGSGPFDLLALEAFLQTLVDSAQ